MTTNAEIIEAAQSLAAWVEGRLCRQADDLAEAQEAIGLLQERLDASLERARDLQTVVDDLWRLAERRKFNLGWQDVLYSLRGWTSEGL